MELETSVLPLVTLLGAIFWFISGFIWLWMTLVRSHRYFHALDHGWVHRV
jgi:hypothetical protein